jgi:signal transduction histidine kinase
MGNVEVKEQTCGPKLSLPPELASSDPEVLRAALRREHDERRRAECLATLQADVVQLALDLLVREPDIEGFFGGLSRNIVEESEGHGCGVWLLDEESDGSKCTLWMSYVGDRLYVHGKDDLERLPYPHESMAAHLVAYKPGWERTVEYAHHDERLPQDIRDFHARADVYSTIVAPLNIGNRTLGWIKLSACGVPSCESAHWWRVVVTEAIARQAALALHFTRLIAAGRVEERNKAILEERNRLARDIHDNLTQGFGAILMQLQAAQRETGPVPLALSQKLDTAIDLARTHMIEARRSVATLRPNVGDGEEINSALKRIANLAQRRTQVPIELQIEPLPRLGDLVEREIVGIAQEALTNAVRHSRARRITVQASTVESLGLRLSIADDGRGFARDRHSGGFGMTSMQERAERIGASLTIVTAPRCGTEVVLAWEPRSTPMQIHVVS